MLIQVALPQAFAGHGGEIAQQLATKNIQPLQVLGTGNFAMTLIASSQSGIVAIKVFLAVGPQKDALERTARHEMRLARALFGLSHIACAFDAWEAPPLFFLAMNYIHGETLASRIDTRGVHSPEQVIQFGEQIAEGLIGLHGKQIIHRDLNPLNCMVTPEDYIYLIDFNISKDAQGTLQDFRKFGTPPYVAPEQYKGVTNEQTDMYSWALILASLALGTTNLPDAKERRDQGAQLAIRASNPSIPVALEAVIEQAAALDPARRFANMQVALKALKSVSAPTGQSVQPISWQAPAMAPAPLKLAPALILAPQPQQPQLPPLPMKQNRCPICGYSHRSKPTYCDSCGAAMDPAVAALVQPAPVQAQAQWKAALAAPANVQMQVQQQPGQPPLLIDPVAQIATVIFGGALRLGGSTLSTFGQLLVIAHYVSIIIMLFLEVGFGLVAHSGDPHDLARAMLFMICALAWFCVRTVRPGAFTRRDYMQRWARRVCLVVVEAFCVVINYIIGQAILRQDWGPLHLVLCILLGIVGLLLNYVAVEIWLN